MAAHAVGAILFVSFRIKSLLKRNITILIVQGFLFRIAQDRVSLIDLFEFLFCSLVSLIGIRVILLREFAECAPDRLFIRLPVHAKYLIKILFCHAAHLLSTI